MKFKPLPLQGAFLIEIELREDSRGSFARTFCATEFAAHGLETHYPQANMSISLRRGILRGLHFQRNDAAEVKLVRVTQGRILDVIVDLRQASPTFGSHTMAELSATNLTMMYVPRGFAHGFLTLEDCTQVCYQVSAPYTPDMEGGVRWNDPWLAIPWPIVSPELSARDATHPDFDPDRCAF